MNSFYQTNEPTETEKVGENVAFSLLSQGKRRAVIAMRGEMGVGKTAFARGFAKVLGIANVKSPTYTIVNEYKGQPIPLFHFDMYRITSEDDLYSIGYDDYLRRDGFCLIEWSENIVDFLPTDVITVSILRGNSENGRNITIEGLNE